MPSSHVSQISTVMELVLATRPQSVLDVGIGFGKFGFLCREYLELWDGREIYADWRRQIDGIEACPEYITPLHNQIYDNIYIGDALNILPKLKSDYDLALIIDVIEHFSIEDGQRLLDACADRCKACLVSTPLIASPQGSAFNNPYETHKSQWTHAEFSKYSNKAFIPNPQSLIAYLRFDGLQVQVQTNQSDEAPVK